METRLPRSPRAKEMRSGPVTPSQDDMTDTAAPVSQTSIARSMSRYRGSRRNVRSHEPALPSTRQTSTTQRTPTREQSNVPGPDRAFLPNHDKMNGFYQASRVENLQSVAPAPPKIGRARRGLRRERNQAATSAEDSVQPQSQVYPQYQAQAEKEDGSRRTDVIHSQRRTLAKGDVGEELWRGKARRHTGSIKGKSGTGPSRPPQDQGVDAGKIDSPRDRPANSHYTNGDIPSFSQRIAAQAPRPQAFRNGSSREELKRMISGPIPTMEQESPAHPSMRPPKHRSMLFLQT